MSKSEALHDLYETCKDISLDESYALIKAAESDEEKQFIRVVTDWFLQQKQKDVIAQKKF